MEAFFFENKRQNSYGSFKGLKNDRCDSKEKSLNIVGVVLK